MYRTAGTSRRGVLFGLLVAVVAMTVMVPSIASAYTAKYSAASPKSGSSSRVTMPTITVTVYAPAGVKGSTNYSLYVDGAKVKPSISYSSKYRKFKLSYRRTTPLKVGRHKATVKIKDRARHTSSYTWSFTVLAPLPPPPPPVIDMKVTIESNACLSCHLGFPAKHPMSACASCHSETGPVDGVLYRPGDESAHTLACSLESPCHGGAGGFPHVLGSDCMSCHDGRYPAIPEFHGAFDPSAHVTTQTFCTGSRCHDTSLTVEHFKYTVDGEPLSCQTCHANPDPQVLAGIASGSTACSACHDLTADPHPGTEEAHAYPPVDCANGNGCHKAADVVGVHKGDCAPCHSPGRALTTNCYSCHPAQPHPDFNLVHTAGPLGCTTAACHSTNVIAIHTVGVSAPGCPACHAEGQPPLTLECEAAGCHVAASEAHSAHPVSPAAEVIAIGGVSYGSRACADCHTPLDLIGLHSGRCLSCHGLTTNATMTGGCGQTGCHASGTLAKHAGIEAAHRLTSVPTCVGAGCHSGANAAALHAAKIGAGATAPGCATCHRPGVTPTLVCGTVGCHSASDSRPMANAHPKMTPGHTVALPATCVGARCHASDLVALHAPAGKCATCHGGSVALTKTCATTGCHVAEIPSAALHPTYDVDHIAAATGCSATGCHSTNAIAIHTQGETPPGCAACHAEGKPALTLTCATVGCHPTLPKVHSAHAVVVPATRIQIDGTDFGTHACSECHAPFELISLHRGACSSCHVGSSMTATFAGGCAQGTCHTSGALAMHAGSTTGHVLAATPSCAGTGCHAGGKNVAALHASTIRAAAAPGCAACHAPGAKLTLICGAAGCHSATDTHPSSNPHPKMAAGHTSALPTSCVTDGCHVSDLATLHAAADGCATCHAPGATPTKTCTTTGCHLATVSSTGLHPKYVTGHTTTQSGCTAAGCHSTSVIGLHTLGRTPPGCRACHASGKPKLTLVCTTSGCHDDGQANHEAHPVAPVAEPVSISGTSFGVHACAECHAPLDLIDLHERACSACHVPTGVTATFAGGCAQGGCHTSGNLTKHGAINTAHAGDTSGCTTGTGCHPGGTNVAAVHKAEGCVVCHEPRRTASGGCAASACHGTGTSHPLSGPHPKMNAGHTTGLPTSCVKSGCHAADLVALHAAKNGCATCHWNGKTATKQCVTSGCHDSGVSAKHASHPAVVAPAAIKINGLGLGTYACTACHASMDLQVIHGGSTGCGACHPGAADAVGTWDGGCTQAACHGTGSTRPMHADVNAAHTMATQPKCTTSGCHQGNSNVGGRDFALMHFPTQQKCAICHQPGQTRSADCASCHAQWATGDHQPDHGYCNDCHAPFKWDPTKAVMGSGDPTGYPGALHWNMFDAPWTLKIGRAVIRQGYPYGDYTMLREPGPLGAPGPYSTTYMDRTVQYTCTACHEGPGKKWVHPAYNNFTCGNTGDCHEHHWVWDPAQGSESYVHLTPPSNWIVPSMRW